jgi:hypothetical protein
MPNPMRLLAALSLLLLACSFFSPASPTPSATPDPTATDDLAGTATASRDATASAVKLPTETPPATDTEILALPTGTRRALTSSTSTRTPPRATATLRASATNFPTAGARRTAPPGGPAAPDFLTTVAGIKRQMEIFGGIIDIAANGDGTVDCQQVVNVHDAVVNAPNFSVPGPLAGAYQLYRNGVGNFATKTNDMYLNCQSVVNGGTSGGIPPQQWQLARQGVNEAVDMLRQAIIAAGGTP